MQQSSKRPGSSGVLAGAPQATRQRMDNDEPTLSMLEDEDIAPAVEEARLAARPPKLTVGMEDRCEARINVNARGAVHEIESVGVQLEEDIRAELEKLYNQGNA